MVEVECTHATMAEFEWLVKTDLHVSEVWIRRTIAHNEYVVAKQLDLPVGFLRFSHFWGVIPFMDMIYVTQENRCQGIGQTLFLFWEEKMRAAAAKGLMTSSMADEPAPQNWHRKNGFAECGQLTFGNFQPEVEVFLVKNF